MPVRMKALRSFGYAGVNEGSVNRGHEFSARDEYRAKDLEAHGLAYRIEAKIAPKQQVDVAATAIPENKAASAGPLDSAGGKTGADAPLPSSPPAQPRRRRRSSRSETDLLS